MTEIPDTYEDLAWKLVKSFPLDTVVLTMFAMHIKKSLSRRMRETSVVFKVKLLFDHINPKYQSINPKYFKGFLKNGNSKTRLTESVRDVISIDKTKVLNMLRTKEIFFSTCNDHKRITAKLYIYRASFSK